MLHRSDPKMRERRLGEDPEIPCFSFAGHVARLDHNMRLAAAVLDWKSDRWRSVYNTSLPNKAGGQPGRRAAGEGRPARPETPFSDVVDILRADPDVRPNIQTLYCRGGRTLDPLHDWRSRCHRNL